ncbi:acrylyl-CoA reductase (NADPH) [Mycetocola miduiensis]|uniref:Acrylyl-CoA reductase (NADPH) n=2 Tax=Mycetocola miduiensis TaxID=995034 RepID=A0A1I4YSJ0_9MICO|nr:acrylyl-CoA reductase (NADPH) [Mycetocola miduiensis]
MMTTFRAWWVSKETDASGTAMQTASVRELRDSDLGAGDTLISVQYSSINYKDGLALCGRPGVVRSWPLIPGIDLAGTVEASDSGAWSPGDRVVLTGAGLGESSHGGLSQRARVDGSALVRVPDALGPLRTAAIGTAGFTAMLSVLAVERHGVSPADGPVLVTGAAGGVGSVAVAVLSRLGFEVVASTGRADSEGEYLSALGASQILDRAALLEPGKPMQSQRYAAVVDSVGSHTLVNAIAQLKDGGVATACGLAQGSDLPGTVLPFILRGVSLAGINSVYAPLPLRQEAWARLERDLDLDLLDGMTEVIPLAAAKDSAERILAGGIRGRTVVDVNA